MCNRQNPGNFFNKCYSSSDIPYKIFWHRHPINYVLWYIYSPEKKIKNTQLFMNQLLSTGSEYKDLEYLNFLPCNSQLNKTEKQFSTFTSWTSHLPFSTTLDAVLSSSPMNGWMAIETAFFVSRCISVIAISMTWDAVYLKEEKSEVTRGITQQKLKFLHYYTTYSSFAMPICTERGPTALAPVTLFHRRCVRHGLAFYFRGEGLAGPDFELPRKWGWSDPMSEPSTSSPR